MAIMAGIPNRMAEMIDKKNLTLMNTMPGQEGRGDGIHGPTMQERVYTIIGFRVSPYDRRGQRPGRRTQ